MLRTLHQVSAVLFYLLGLAFFTAYILENRDMGGMYPLWVLTKLDLPLLLCGALYGGSSICLSIDEHGHSRALQWIVWIPLTLIFLTFVAFNFWNLLIQ